MQSMEQLTIEKSKAEKEIKSGQLLKRRPGERCRKKGAEKVCAANWNEKKNEKD